jgi:hypothetical protein
MITFNYIRDWWNAYSYNREKKAFLKWLLYAFSKKDVYWKEELRCSNPLFKPFDVDKAIDVVLFYNYFWIDNSLFYGNHTFEQWLIECIKRELSEM